MVQKQKISRRKFLQFAAFSAAIASPFLYSLTKNKSGTLIEWDGVALGADSNMQVYHEDKEFAKRILRESLTEITRLEKMFSLYREDSLINKLNKDGYLKNPPKEFAQIIKKSIYFGDITRGQFDITVQPLWDKSGGVELVDYKKINISDDEISFAKQGMKITLNGIAQGYITDKIAEYMRGHGVQNALISLGEKYAIGPRPDGEKWRIGIAGSDIIVELQDQGISTSSSSESRHIFNPRTGKTMLTKSVTVIASSATKADALSTALSLGDIDGIEEDQKIRII